MFCFPTTFALLLLLVAAGAAKSAPLMRKHVEVVETARESMQQAIFWAHGFNTLDGLGPEPGLSINVALRDCAMLYEDAESRLARLVSGDGRDDDGVNWLSAALAGHNTCVEGLGEMGVSFEARRADNLTSLIREALAVYRAESNLRDKTRGSSAGPVPKRPGPSHEGGLLATWNPATSKADLVVAQDGSGNYKTINEAVAAIARSGHNRPERILVHVKSGVYKEKVEIKKELNNIMLVGDGIDKTIVTANQNVRDGGTTTFNSATFGVSGDGFWARDMTFENTAGPEKHQAVALRVSSDHSVFYRCSFRGYQDTLFVHSLRQFYRSCHVYGTVDFIFGDAAAVFQDCDLFLRRPMEQQFNTITAQGRSDPNQNTGISILNCRVRGESKSVGRFRNFLGRPWKEYSRTVFLKTDLDGLIDGRGWKEWKGGFALSTLYYAEFMNTGAGATTAARVKWPGFHVLSPSDVREAEKFAVENFIAGESWIPPTGVPFSAGL